MIFCPPMLLWVLALVGMAAFGLGVLVFKQARHDMKTWYAEESHSAPRRISE